MFILLADLKPKIGMIGEMRSILKDWGDSRNAGGHRTVVSETFWHADGAQMRVATFHDSIADAAADREAINASQEFKDFATKMAPTMAEPVSWSLRELILPAPNPVNARYALHVGLQAAVGKPGELREILTDWVTHSHSKGNTIGLTQEIWGARGGYFGLRIPFHSLAEAEESRAALESDPEYPKFMSKLPGVLAEPASWRLAEVISGPAD